MSREQRAGQAAMTSELRSEAGGPRWRALLEARWQARLRELTELSLAYHVAVAAPLSAASAGSASAGSASPGSASPGSASPAGRPEAQTLLRQTVTARRKLADVEEALSRLAAGQFGRCEQCGGQIPDGLLATAPEIRYCARCDGEPSAIRPLAGRAR
jgi:RNA polymerase-binding transcription factor DksA